MCARAHRCTRHARWVCSFGFHQMAMMAGIADADYVAAGADIVETNSFSATTIGMADYHLESIVTELNHAAVACARRAARAAEAATPGRRSCSGRRT